MSFEMDEVSGITYLYPKTASGEAPDRDFFAAGQLALPLGVAGASAALA